MFYRSLPTDYAQYSSVSASCVENPEFSYEVADNPDMDGFLDINCIGGAQRGNSWTYVITYIMEGTQDTGDSLSIDVIPFGFTVDLNKVSVTVNFPTEIKESNYALYVGYGSTEKHYGELTNGGKTLTYYEDKLKVRYNPVYDEYVAEGITLDFTLPSGILQDTRMTRIFTKEIGGLVVGAVAVAGFAVCALIMLRKKRDIITVVNLKAPDDMDPMRMGKMLDGNVDQEDLTSMIYYFAHKGYLEIDLTNEDDPVLIQKQEALPEDSTPYEKTIFYGLFKFATRETIFSEEGNTARVTIPTSELAEQFYVSADKAIKQVPPVKMYEKQSIFGYVSGGLLGVLFSFIACLLMGFTVSPTYLFSMGFVFFVPAAVILVLGYVRENYRYKWSKLKLWGMTALQIVVALVYTAIFVALFGNFFMTEAEKIVVCAGSFAALFVTLPALSRTEKYVQELGDILGFKEFIVVTEEDKIKFMLEENPQLYYKILPYAQVLGVTKEWTDKFENITLEPPQWCHGTDLTFFDYWYINRCMTRAMVVAMSRPQQSSGGGSFMGRSGGGGFGGGFGGGGFGGGGGGAR